MKHSLMPRTATAAICSVCLIALGCLSLAHADEPLLGHNLIPNGDFEQWTDKGLPQGWSAQANGAECSADEEYRADGTKSARLVLSKTPGYMQLISPTVAATAGHYLVRFTFRVVGLSKSQSYEGGQADMQIRWLGDGGKMLRNDYVGSTYFPLEWSYRDQFYSAPPGTTAIRVAVSVSGNPPLQTPTTAWFDDVAVCLYHPPLGVGEMVTREWSVTAGQELPKVPDAPAWFYLSGKEGGESTQAERVRDGDALLGWALHAKSGVPEGMVFHSPYTVEQPPGLYRAFFRMKSSAFTKLKPDAPLANVDVISNDSGFRGSHVVTSTDFKVPGQYSDIALDFVKRTSGWIALRVMTPGKDAESWLDHVRVVQLRRFSDPDLLAWYPGVGGSLGAKPSIDRGTRPRVLLVKGLIAEAFRVEESAQKWPECEVTMLPYSVGQSGPSVERYPSLWNDLRKYDVIVFANASIDALGPEQRYQLMEFVRAGGGLVLLGGKAAYGNGGLRGSFLEKALPVQVSQERFDIQPCSGTLTRTSSVAVGNPLWARNVVCPYLHRVSEKPGAKISVSAGSVPVLVTATFGQGRIVCFTVTPYGIAPAGMTLFSDWKDWPLLMRNVLQWVSSRKT